MGRAPSCCLRSRRRYGEIGQAFHLLPHPRHHIENEAGENAQHADNRQSDVQDGRGEARHQTGFEIGLHDRDRGCDPDRDQRQPEQPEKGSGRSFFTRAAMRRRMRTPSRKVLSLLTEPRGLSRYAVGASWHGMRSSSACTVSSVSISNPCDAAGNDLTYRRDRTL